MDRMGGGHKGEGRGDDFARDTSVLYYRLKRNHTVGEETEMFDAQILSQSRFKLLVELTIVGQPFRLPYLFKIGDELLQRRKGRGCDIDGFFKRLSHIRLSIVCVYGIARQHGASTVIITANRRYPTRLRVQHGTTC